MCESKGPGRCSKGIFVYLCNNAQKLARILELETESELIQFFGKIPELNSVQFS